MISLNEMVHAVIVLLVAGLILGLLYWLIGFCGVPEPFNKVARVVLAIFAVLVCIGVLLGLAGYPVLRP